MKKIHAYSDTPDSLRQFIEKTADYYERFVVGDGSASLIINSATKDASCMFGDIKMPTNFKDAVVLFSQLEQKALQLGYYQLVGPINYCSWFPYRWAIDRFDFQIFPDCSNAKFYVEYIKKLGYQIMQTYRSATVSLKNPIVIKGEQKYKILRKNNIIFEQYKGDEATPMAQELFSVSMRAFEDSSFYAPIDFTTFQQLYLKQLMLLDVDIIVAREDNTIIGYVLGYPDPHNDKHYIAKTSAVLPEYQTQGIYSAMLYLAAQMLKERGYNQCIFHFQNIGKKTFRHFDVQTETNEKHYAVFSKQLKELS